MKDRHGKGALIIASQPPVSKWYEKVFFCQPLFGRFKKIQIIPPHTWVNSDIGIEQFCVVY